MITCPAPSSEGAKKNWASTRLRVAMHVMRYYFSGALLGAKPVITPYRGGAYHRFTGGYDYVGECPVLAVYYKAAGRDCHERERQAAL